MKIVMNLVVGLIIFIAGITTGYYSHRNEPLSGNYLKLDFKPGDRVVGPHYKAGGEKEENALGTVIGLNYNPVWNPEAPLYYFVVFDADLPRPDGNRTASGLKASDLKTLRK